MRLVKIARRAWVNYKEAYAQHYYLARVFDPDTEQMRALLDDAGEVVGAVSYSIEPTHVAVYSLQSLVPGGGSRLMAHVERVAYKERLDVRVASERSAVGFYAKRGYRKLPGQCRSCKIFFMKKGYKRLYFSQN